MTFHERRPWWAAALAGGFGAVLAVLFGLGVIGTGGEAKAQVADANRLTRIESRLNDIGDRLARIEGKLERK